MTTSYDVIVVGGGMVGSSAALALAQQGFSVAVIERQKLAGEPMELTEAYDLRVSAISPSSQALLSELGVWQEITRMRSCDYHKMFIWHENGNSVVRFASEQLGLAHLGTIVENRLIQWSLQQVLQGLSNVHFFTEQQVVHIENGSDEVQVKTSTGRFVHAQLLIAADGRESSVRNLLKLPVISGSYQQSAIVANVSTEKSHDNTAWQRFLVTGPLAFLPLSNGQSSIVWSVDDDQVDKLMDLSDTAFTEALSAAFEFRLGAVTQTSARAAFPLNWHNAQQWLQQRVLLIGDAAHGVHPLAGQGVNLGFADVALLKTLFYGQSAIYQPRLLRRFERQRKAEAASATHLFSLLKLLYGQQGGLICRVRDLGMSIVDANMMLKRLIMNSAVKNMA
ncbi:MAG: FAD-dependent oxidoreductase [Gammaproteobacteria bacterium]|nr:FAD-dependent oxidoreductase [Gammaproteobacteria bacterium]